MKSIFRNKLAFIFALLLIPTFLFAQVDDYDFDDYYEYDGLDFDEGIFDGYEYDDTDSDISSGGAWSFRGDDDYEDYEQTDIQTSSNTSGLYYLTDDAGLLTDSQNAELEERLQRMSQQYGIGIYIITIQDYTAWGSDVEAASEKIRYTYNLGLGERDSSLLLLLSMNDRSYDVAAHGLGRTAFDRKKDDLIEAFKDDFRGNNWYNGLSDYVSCAESILTGDRAGGVDYEAEYQRGIENSHKLFYWIIALVVVFIAFCFSITRLHLEKKKMKNVAEADNADSYVSENGVEFTNKQDVFKYSTSFTRTIETSSSSGSGGTSHSSGHF